MNILGLKLDLGRMINVLNVFVPVIKQSSVEGYQSGLMVESTGIDNKDNCGYAGGYVGKLIGGQIWGDNTAHCQVKKLRRVDGRSYVGGFVGSSRPGSVATLNPTAGEGLLSSNAGTNSRAVRQEPYKSVVATSGTAILNSVKMPVINSKICLSFFFIVHTLPASALFTISKNSLIP